MTLQTIIDTLKAIGLTQPNVRTATEGDIYRALDGNPSVKYGVFHLSQTTHHERENTDVYGFNLFYVDRLEDDMANRTQIQSIGKSVIGNIVSTFCDRMDGEHSEITYTPFTERFTDECAGVYATLTFEVMKEWECPEYYEEGWVTPQVVIRNQVKTIQVTESGVYTVTPDEGYTGLEKVIVDAELADTVQKRKNFTADRNKSVWVVYPDEPYLSIGSLQVDVDIPMQEKELEITANGDYTVNADGNYGGLEEVRVKVDIPIQDRKEVRVTDPGFTVINADEGYESMKSVGVDFEYIPKAVIPNYVSFAGSTFSEFPFENYDWSVCYDANGMFANCKNLNCEKVLDFLQNGDHNILSIANILRDNHIEKIENFDFSKFWNTFLALDNITGLKEIRNCKLGINPNSDYSYGCTRLKNDEKKYKVVDCDWSGYRPHISAGVGYYFANFNVFPTDLTDGYDAVSVVHEARPSWFKGNSVCEIWCPEEFLDTWSGVTAYPFGLSFNFITNLDKVESVVLKSTPTANYVNEQVIPYDKERGCYYADYPEMKLYDVYINGKLTPIPKGRTTDVYLPSTEAGVYTGENIANLIYFYFNSDGFTLDNHGLATKERYGSARQNIATPGNSLVITIEKSSGTCYLYINNVLNLISDGVQQVTVDTTNLDYVEFRMYTGNPENVTITSLEII